MKRKPGHFKKLLKESLAKNLNEQFYVGPWAECHEFYEAFIDRCNISPIWNAFENQYMDICYGETAAEMYDYCLAHCHMGMIWHLQNLPYCSQNIGNFVEHCCPDDSESCPEGMIDDTSSYWGSCLKCWDDVVNATVVTGPDCECCRPVDEPEEKLTCYRCSKKGGNTVQAVQFPNSLSAWANFNFQGECPKGYTTNPDPCNPPGTVAGMSLPPRNRQRR